MLTKDQVTHFKSFGFVILRQFFSPEEMRLINDEFEYRSKVASSYKAFDGSERHNIRMMGSDTPFFSALLEDPRFSVAAEQMFGSVIGHNIDADRYTGNTPWHYDAGAYEGPGVKFAFYLQPVRADTGALRVIPGSHKKQWFDEIYNYEGVGPRWTRAARTEEEAGIASKAISEIPAYVCNSDPGDVVAFDLRLYHASLGGSDDRHMCSVNYYIDPDTPEQYEVIIRNVQGHLNTESEPSDAWNPHSVYQDWMANRGGSDKRQQWIDRMIEISKMETGVRGFDVQYGDGKMKVVSS